jgi:hypothetical protein
MAATSRGLARRRTLHISAIPGRWLSATALKPFGAGADTSRVTASAQPRVAEAAPAATSRTSPPARRHSTAVWAAAGTLLALAYLFLDIWSSGHGILRPIRAGSRGPGAALIARDFPQVTAPDEVGLDGQQFYAIARDPFHPETVATSLDRPQYRYQRPFYPAVAWLLHPTGGGAGLVVAFVVVSLLGLFLGGVAMGMLAQLLRAPPWLALLFPLLPGAVWSLTSSVADALAVALCLVTIVATLRDRSGIAWLAAVAAVLTRETAILVPLALFLARRRRSDLPLVVLPGLALGAWLFIVRLAVPSGGLPSERLVFPLTGLLDAVRERWILGDELIGMASTLAALTVAAFVLLRRRGVPELRWVIGVQLAFLSVCSGAVLGDDFGGTRSTLMLLTVAVAALLAGTRAPAPAPSG